MKRDSLNKKFCENSYFVSEFKIVAAMTDKTNFESIGNLVSISVVYNVIIFSKR